MTPNKDKTIEQEKLVAEKLNGRLAMLGIIAGIGAYLNRSTHSRLRVMKSVPVPLRVVPYIFMVAVISAIPMGVLV